MRNDSMPLRFTTGLRLYPNAADLISERGVAYMSNSDIHQPIADRYGGAGLRPMTILFCREHTRWGCAKQSKRAGRWPILMVYWSDAPICSRSSSRRALHGIRFVRPKGVMKSPIRRNCRLNFLVGEACYDIAPNSTIRFTMKTPQPMMLKNCFTGARSKARNSLVAIFLSCLMIPQV